MKVAKLVAATVAALLVVQASAGGATARRNAAPTVGTIAFIGSANFDLEVVNASGSASRRLTACPSADCVIEEFAWSPSGRQIAFSRGRPAGPHTRWDLSLFVINADGSGLKRLAKCGDRYSDGCGPSWSPDGSQIVFSSRGSLYVASADGGGVRRLVDCWNSACYFAHPVWSPVGARIVFTEWHLLGITQSLYAVDVDGSHLAKLTNLAGWASNPAWAPDGSRIAFDSTNGKTDRIYAMDADGSHLHVLFSGPPASGPGVPSWSRDGSRLLFFDTPGTPGQYSAEVWVMKADGTDAHRLYHSTCCVRVWGAPRWSPDEQSIAFSADTAGGTSVMRADGSDVRNLAPTTLQLAWQPVR